MNRETSETLRVLVVEDSEDDTLLLTRHLQQGGYDPQVERVDSAKAMERALEERTWDLVICDYAMPRFTVFGALRLIKERGDDLPFIVVSGAIGEETAVACMKAGAHDYLMKDNLNRLIPAIKRELAEAEIRRERTRAQEKLRKAHAELERRVDERTAELVRKNEQLLAEINERERAQQALKESEARFRQIYDKVPLMIHSIDREGRIRNVNRKWLSEMGYSAAEVLGRTIDFILPPDIRATGGNMLSRLWNDGVEVDVDTRLIKKDGTIIEALLNSAVMVDPTDGPVGLSVIQDVTDRNRMEDRLRQAQKMEAIGTLAGGIAHDFNNILYAIVGFVELALEDLPPDARGAKNLREALEAADRARHVVHQILAFSRQSEQDRRPIQIGPVVTEVMRLLRASLPSTIELHHRTEQDLGLILADPTQIHQILMNLCANSFHAMRTKGGMLDIKLEKASLDADFFERHPHVSPGRHVRLSVRDTGSGIPADSMHRIFEPYFTTKPKGEGTGLGLSVVHGIVKSCGGAIEVHSEPGEGTLFELYFPVFGDREVRREEAGEEPVYPGNERILFVDDELAIAQLGQQLLEGMGYEVVTRTSSVEALELFKVKPDLFDLIITDMTMPNMTGVELTREIRRLRPDVPVILCTGFSELISEDGTRALGIREVVMKPVLKNELAAAIRRAIDS